MSQHMMMAAAFNEQGEKERVEAERGAKDAHEAAERREEEKREEERRRHAEKQEAERLFMRKFIRGGGGLSELAPEFVPTKS